MTTYIFHKKGLTLVETLIYIFILSLTVIVVVNSLGVFIRSHQNIQSIKSIDTSSIVALERITREIRDAVSVNTGESTLGTSPGVLVINTTQNDGSPTIIRFDVVNDRVRVAEGGIDIGPLTDSRTRVTHLVFRQIQTSRSEAVKIEMTLESGSGSSYKSKNFYSTIVLRGSYESQ